mmetsp:Transcript_33966/g.83457  ORF Transcript_33966/g.83457 Transcript_33966/m.83457 type:complete len:214 (+) Transcript_33966:173-814(+)
MLRRVGEPLLLPAAVLLAITGEPSAPSSSTLPHLCCCAALPLARRAALELFQPSGSLNPVETASSVALLGFLPYEALILGSAGLSDHAGESRSAAPSRVSSRRTMDEVMIQSWSALSALEPPAELSERRRLALRAVGVRCDEGVDGWCSASFSTRAACSTALASPPPSSLLTMLLSLRGGAWLLRRSPRPKVPNSEAESSSSEKSSLSERSVV